MAQIQNVSVPDIGDFEGVEVIEILVSPGDKVNAEDSLVTLESEKAAMEIPAPMEGVVKSIKVNLGDQVSEGDIIVEIETAGAEAAPETAAPEAVEPAAPPEEAAPPPPKQEGAVPPPASSSVPDPRAPKQLPPEPERVDEPAEKTIHASPAVRKLAREFGVDLNGVSGSGRKGRLLKEDVQAYVKTTLQSRPAASEDKGAAPAGAGIPEVPAVDFSKFGETVTEPLTRIQRASGPNLHRSWLNIPHVTQFDDADITELEAFRKSLKGQAEQRGVKVTLLSFMIKAAVAALKMHPRLNSSLAPDKENIIVKQYYHIGFAADTPEGLVVPVIRDADRKGLFELAEELGDLSEKARTKKLMPKDMQGASFTISSLGGIGGTMFTPVVNAPEVAILGVSRAKMQPVWQDDEFVPRLIAPLSLSYDHRVVDGALGARFVTYLSYILSDPKNLLL